METNKRQVILAASDDTIDHVIRLLNISVNDEIKNIVKQLKAEQKRLFHTTEPTKRGVK